MDASGDHGDSPTHAGDGEGCPHSAGTAGGLGQVRDSSHLPLALRNSPAMLRHLGGQLGWHRRTAIVNDELEQQLRCLDGVQWHVVRNLPICSVAIPVLLFGPCGVFLLQGSRGFWTDEDVALMSRAAVTLGSVMRDYPDPVRPCIVILGGEDQERHHFTGAGEGPSWVVSDRRLVPWLLRYQDHGFSEGDIACLREEAHPARIRELARNLLPRGVGHAPGTSPEDFFFPG